MAAGRSCLVQPDGAAVTHKGGVCQDDLRLIGEDVELDDVAVTVPVDDLGVCGGKRKRKRQEKRSRK